METMIESVSRAAVWTAKNSLEASLLIGAFLLLFAAFGRQLSPTLRVVLWTVIGARLLLPFAPPSEFSVHNLVPALSAVEKVSQPTEVVLPETSERFVEIDPVLRAENAGSADTASIPHLPQSPALSWQHGLALAWGLVGFGIFLFAIVRQRIAHRKIVRLPRVKSETLNALLTACQRRAEVRRRLRMVAAPSGSGVAVFGFLRVTHLIVPADLEERYSETEIRGILLHELAHVRRGDLLINWIVLAVECLHWFNPLVWFAGRRFLADREVLCDRAALRGLNSEQRRDYGTALIKALQLGRAPQSCPALVPFVSRKAELEHRLTMIAKPHSRSLFLQLTAAAFAVAAAATLFTSAQADDERGSPRDGERENAERSREGERESGDRSREGDRPREGDGNRPREGARDGERPRESARDGDRPREGARDGNGSMARADHEVKVFRDGVSFGGQKFSTMAEFREALRGQSGSSASVSADSNTPFQTVNAVIDTLKASGVREVTLAQRDPVGDRGSREGARDGDRPRQGEMRREGDGDRGSREGARDGDRPREGEGSREGARDGDRPREGEMRREGDGDRGSREGARDGEAAESSASATDREVNQWTRIYGVYDKNGDHAVTFAEWVAMKNYELTSDQRDREKGWFDEADGNSDEKLTLGEWIDWKASQGRRD